MRYLVLRVLAQQQLIVDRVNIDRVTHHRSHPPFWHYVAYRPSNLGLDLDAELVVALVAVVECCRRNKQPTAFWLLATRIFRTCG